MDATDERKPEGTSEMPPIQSPKMEPRSYLTFTVKRCNNRLLVVVHNHNGRGHQIQTQLAERGESALRILGAWLADRGIRRFSRRTVLVLGVLFPSAILLVVAMIALALLFFLRGIG